MATTTFEKPMGAEVEALKGQIGTLSSLTTAAKGSAVSAINEINSKTTPQTVSGCAMATGWGNPKCDCQKIGKLVFVNIYGDNTSGSTMTNIATGLPACASGNNQILTHYGAGGASVSPAFGYIDSNGNMILRNIAGNTIPYGDSVFGNLVYLTN